MGGFSEVGGFSLPALSAPLEALSAGAVVTAEAGVVPSLAKAAPFSRSLIAAVSPREVLGGAATDSSDASS